MPLPYDARRLSAIRDFPSWKRALEQVVTQLDDRIAARGVAAMARSTEASSSGQPGEAVIWLGPVLPDGLLPTDGTTVLIEDHPDLYDAIGDTCTTGDEPEGTFRLPTMSAPPAGIYAVRA